VSIAATAVVTNIEAEFTKAENIDILCCEGCCGLCSGRRTRREIKCHTISFLLLFFYLIRRIFHLIFILYISVEFFVRARTSSRLGVSTTTLKKTYNLIELNNNNNNKNKKKAIFDIS
jgi:hypothetical protein